MTANEENFPNSTFNKDQINKILDLDSSCSVQQEVVYILNGIGTDNINTKMAKEQYFELKKVKVRSRKRNDSSDSDSGQQSVEKPLYGDKDIIYVDLKSDDSLQKLALTFNCSVAEIKLANKIYTEQDLFALKTIKIPVVKGGTLCKQYEQDSQKTKLDEPNRDEIIKKFNDNIESKYKFRIQSNNYINPELSYMSDSDDEVIFNTRNNSESSPLLNDTDISSVQLGQPINQHNAAFNDFIEEMDRKIENEVAKVEARKDNLKEVVDSLKTTVIFPLGKKTQPEKYGSICSITWTNFLCIFCLVAIFLPALGYIYYYYYKGHKKH